MTWRCLTCGSVWPRKQIPHHDDRNPEDPEQNCPIERGWEAVNPELNKCDYCGAMHHPLQGFPQCCISALAAQNAELRKALDQHVADVKTRNFDGDLASLREKLEKLESEFLCERVERLESANRESIEMFGEMHERLVVLREAAELQAHLNPSSPPLSRRMKGTGPAVMSEHDRVDDCVLAGCAPVTPPEKAFVDLQDDEAELVAAMSGEPNTPPEKKEERCAFQWQGFRHIAECGKLRSGLVHAAPNWRTPPDMLGHPFTAEKIDNTHVMTEFGPLTAPAPEPLCEHGKTLHCQSAPELREKPDPVYFAGDQPMPDDPPPYEYPEPRESGRMKCAKYPYCAHVGTCEELPEPRESGKRGPLSVYEAHERGTCGCKGSPAQREKENDGRSGVQSDASGTVSSAGATPASSLSTPAADEGIQPHPGGCKCAICPPRADSRTEGEKRADRDAEIRIQNELHYGGYNDPEPPRADSPAKREMILHYASAFDDGANGYWRWRECKVHPRQECAARDHVRVVDAEWAEREIHNITLANSENKRLAREAQAAAVLDREKLERAAEIFKRLPRLRVQSQDASCMGTTTIAGINANRAAVEAIQTLYDDADAWLRALSDAPTREEKP